MIQQKCAICESNNYEVVYKENFDIKKINSRVFSARRLPDRVHYRMVRCKNCNLVFSDPILEYDKIEKLYAKSFTSYDKHLENLKETYGYYLKLLPCHPRPDRGSREKQLDSRFHGNDNPTLLEIGCGNGFFLEEAKRQGYDIYGVEPGKPSVDKARPDIKKNIKNDIFKAKMFKKNSFDVICCFQTFDHIPNPNAILAECYKILRKGGLILFLNHDIGAWQNKLMGEKSPIIDIEHTYLFNKKTMRKIFEKHGFKVLEVKSSFNIHHLSYWLHLFPIPNFLKIPLIKFLDKTGIGKIKLKLNPGNLVLIAEK
ncbi:hypothetical protein A2954_01275 [Candidatus Roizmanbacteria bacterium RIFCSPLOWO2_01_FULL_37_12]|uniref:Methyltransferase type 11 domain-containing protein n=1 Tax=Candidatus Roizmanbacteria bacterium RIFCSPLOWO2_01_FULL_37_12 TaxID=1802056 RepID=A0A1F7IGG7_9BACT|nr:MAG: hypothetical protein A3D76_06015 [Candidatus Roizmanbacteria bacterium RIFCSPHIGHO2_02_FULL_37_9b]OGK42456.1 MAG: hypothetical protein A2954_01275 [Candidatus Roizmanbacteria bacterium RIFCSPLOWO2_01_FULL_37_12]